MKTVPLTVKTYGVGTKSYLDTPFNGLVPCIVTGIDGESFGHVAETILRLTVRLSATQGPYRRGEEIRTTAYDCPPRNHVIRRRYTRTVNPNYRYSAE